MKRISILLLTVASAVLFFSSCNKEYAEPTITWTPDDLSHFVTIGEEDTYNKTLNVTFNAEAGIAEIQVWKHTYKMGDIESVVWATPTGFDGLLTFEYTLTTDNVEADFGGGVTKIVYEVEVTDLSETPQTTTKEYTFMIDEAYAVTFAVEDEAGNAITDAKVTFNTVEMTAAPYVYNFIQEGTYTYTVEKAGYQTVTVTDFVMPANDTTVTVELVDLLSAYSESIFITQSTTSGYATYNGVRVEDTENTTIGVKYHTNTASTIVIQPTANCQGFVEVANDDFASYTEIVNAYTNGTELDEYELPFDYDSKAYAAKYFIAKVDGAYVLVKYIDGFVNPNAHDGNLGNIIVFRYKM